MRRPLAVFTGSLVVMIVTATGTVAVLESREPGLGFGYGMHQLMAGRADGGVQLGSAPPGRMHGAAVVTELDYLTHMVAHHEEAVAAARQLERSGRPEMRAFGESIVASQTAQIDQMQDWLTEWYPARPTDSDYQPMMRDLSRLTGDELDRVFLQDMIPHHMTAVMMSQQLLVRGVSEHDEVSELAVSIRDEQHAEIAWMRRSLVTWFDEDSGRRVVP